MYSSTLSLISVLDGGGWSTPRPDRFNPRKTRYPLCRRFGRAQGWSERVRESLPVPEFDPRTVQPVASRYTDTATSAPLLLPVKLTNLFL